MSNSSDVDADLDKIFAVADLDDSQADVFARTRPKIPARNERKRIGAAYEDYVGYLLEHACWDVTFHGARHGRKDGGIDIVATHSRRRYAFQCKGWRREAKIDDWQILKFKRDAEEFEINENTAFDILAFVTSADITARGRRMATKLGVILKHLPWGNWPKIKCNICPKTGARQYYLPGDPGYRSVKISRAQGECYAHTEDEARSYNFTRPTS